MASDKRLASSLYHCRVRKKKLIPSHPGCKIFGLKVATYGLGDAADDRIPGGVSLDVIYHFQVIDIQNNGQLRPVWWPWPVQ